MKGRESLSNKDLNMVPDDDKWPGVEKSRQVYKDNVQIVPYSEEERANVSERRELS